MKLNSSGLLKALIVGCLCLTTAVVYAQAETPPQKPQEQTLKKVDEMPIPTLEELLSKPPVDWIVLRPPRRDEVLVVQPISPRPDTIARMNKMAEDLRSSAKRPKQDQGESAEQYRQRIRDLQDEAENLVVLFPLVEGVKPEEQDANEYRLNVQKHVDRIIYHEDLMLKRADLLMNEGQLSKAFELLLVLERRQAEWPGYTERRNRLIYEEAKQQTEAGNIEAAFAYFEELHTVAPKYTGLREAMGTAAEGLIDGAMKANEPVRARFYLMRLRKRDPENPVSVKWTDYFLKQADEVLAKAKTAREESQHALALELVEEAARIWPLHPQLKSLHRAAVNRYQLLHVGVTRFPTDPAPYPLKTPEQQRISELQAVELFEIGRIERNPQYQSRYIEEWTPTDLGRQVVFQLRPRRASWEASPLVSATQVVQSLSERLRPESEHFDERLKNYVRSVSVKSPYEFVVNLSKIPVRPQAIFRFPVITGDESGGDGAAGAEFTSQRFRITNKTDDRVSYRRAIPEPDTSPQFHVAEIVEHRYPTTDSAIQALMRGDVSLFPNPPIWLADRIERADIFQVEPFAVPTSHVLQFNSRSEVLKNNEVRRAVAYAINRERILKEVVFRGEKVSRGRLITAPYSSKNYAYNPQVEPHKFDLPLAFALTSVSKKKFGGKLPELTMICEPDETSIRCCEEFIKDWAKVGITVKLISDPKESAPEQWDIVYRTVRMVEPVTEMWPFLTISPDARVRELEHLPDWLRQSLIELEQSADLTTAISSLRRLHLRLHEFVQFVPLWELDDVLVIRRNIQGVPPGPLHPYHNVERWIVQPWYAAELQGESS